MTWGIDFVHSFTKSYPWTMFTLTTTVGPDERREELVLR